MICSSAFWKEKYENLKNISLTFFKFQSIPTYPVSRSLAKGTNRQFYRSGVITYNKLDNHFVVSADRQTFLGFEMTADLRDTFPLREVFFLDSTCTFMATSLGRGNDPRNFSTPRNCRWEFWTGKRSNPISSDQESSINSLVSPLVNPSSDVRLYYHLHGKPGNSTWKIRWYASFHLEYF